MTTLFWHVECPKTGNSLDFKTTGQHIEPIPASWPLDRCLSCGQPHEAARCTETEHAAYVADCTGTEACPAYYHEHHCGADKDGTTCRRPEAHTARRWPAFLGVSCEGPSTDGQGCDMVLEADFFVGELDDKATRLGVILDYVVREKGWTVTGRDDPETAIAWCPECVALLKGGHAPGVEHGPGCGHQPPPEGWPAAGEQDLSGCPYYRQDGSLGANGPNTCGSGCQSEPACQTGRPLEGWPSERRTTVPS